MKDRIINALWWAAVRLPQPLRRWAIRLLAPDVDLDYPEPTVGERGVW